MSNKVLLVTGGSRGIGRSTAMIAARDGWAVAINYASNAGPANDAVSEIQEMGGRAVSVQADIADEASVIAMFDTTTEKLGPITALVANAGTNFPPAHLVDMEAERMSRIFSVNLLGTYLCAREAARCMSTKRGGNGGSIVAMSSVASRLGTPNEYVDYAGSKGGVDSMVIGLAKELGPVGIRVNAIRPGLIDTEFHMTAGDPDRVERASSGVPLGRAGTPDEIAEAAVWLISDKASYVSGAILDVTGGR